MADRYQEFAARLSPQEREEMRKALGAPAPAQAGFTVAELDAAVDELRKGVTAADFVPSSEAAVDVGPFLESLVADLRKGYGAVHSAQDTLASGMVATCNMIKALGSEIVGLRDDLEAMAKGLRMPEPRRSVQSDHDIVPPPGPASEPDAALTRDDVARGLLKGMEKASDPMIKAQLGGWVSDVESGGQITPEFLTKARRLGADFQKGG